MIFIILDQLILYLMMKDWMLSQKQTKQRRPLLPLIFHVILEVLARATRQRLNMELDPAYPNKLQRSK